MITHQRTATAPADDASPRRREIRATLADPAEPALFFQPIVDLRRGVVAGYEALARFSSEPTLPPDRWFAEAARAGLAAEVEARVFRAALAARDRMPPRCFLTVNAMPHLLSDPEVRDVWQGADLRHLVIELNEAVDIESTVDLAATIRALRTQGAFVAMDDVGSGYAGLRQLARVRPDFVKLDGSLVINIDDDQVKITIAELVGSFSSRLNAWVIAEGIQRHAELDTLVALGVPLGQGFLLGRPAPRWQRLDLGVARRIRAQSANSELAPSIVSLMEQAQISTGDAAACGRTPDCPSCPASASPASGRRDDEPSEGGATIIVSNRCRPVALWLTGSATGDGSDERRVPTSLFALPEEPLTEVARRAMTRPRASRFDPVIIVTEMGRPLGLVRMERLMLRLAEMSAT